MGLQKYEKPNLISMAFASRAEGADCAGYGLAATNLCSTGSSAGGNCGEGSYATGDGSIHGISPGGGCYDTGNVATWCLAGGNQ